MVDDYHARIRNARAKSGMTQKELAMKLNEKQTIISKIESGTMRPDEKLIKKLQRELGVVLKEKVRAEQEERLTPRSAGSGSLTLADLIRTKKD